MDVWHDKWDEAWDGVDDVDPRRAPGDKVLCTTYAAWMAAPDDSPAPYYDYNDVIDSGHLHELMQLRLGVHWLKVCTGRWSGLPRNQRRCELCAGFSVEDEKHFMMECTAYRDIRLDYASLYEDADGDMRSLMCHANQRKVARLVHDLKGCRDGIPLERRFDSHLDPLEDDWVADAL